MKRFVVLASGRGSNFQAILEEVQKGNINGEIVAVISDNHNANALEIAREAGIEAVYGNAKSDEYKDWLLGTVQSYAPDYVLLAGYMRIVPPEFVSMFPQRIINIHPALLPSFPGLHGQRQALEYGVKITGCTVHYVDEGMDTGKIIAQKAVPVLEDDTEDTLSARILVEEHKLYPAVVKMLAEQE
ncbi:MAG: phosphoribosylglycinamide formyltransferase [Bacillota bacterium]|nr:phosphoribosylglycinamide formyltransferase [Bacillota bacterium]